MSEATKKSASKKTATKTATKSAAKKEAKTVTKKAPTERARTESRTIGETVSMLLARAKSTSGLSVAKALAGDKQVSKKDVVSLRDSINGVSAKLREEGSDNSIVLALALAHINMRVQRLARIAK